MAADFSWLMPMHSSMGLGETAEADIDKHGDLRRRLHGHSVRSDFIRELGTIKSNPRIIK